MVCSEFQEVAYFCIQSDPQMHRKCSHAETHAAAAPLASNLRVHPIYCAELSSRFHSDILKGTLCPTFMPGCHPLQ